MPIVLLILILVIGIPLSLLAGTKGLLPFAAIVTTFFAGYLGSAFLGTAMNWPDAGAIVAVATMGGFILWAVRHPRPPQNGGGQKDE